MKVIPETIVRIKFDIYVFIKEPMQIIVRHTDFFSKVALHFFVY